MLSFLLNFFIYLMASFGDASRAVKHMNEDHASSILAFAHFYAGKPHAKEAKLISATSAGFTVLIDGSTSVLIPYPPSCSVSTSKDLRKAAVHMHKEAFHGMGWGYKLRRGYYKDVAKILWGVARKRKGMKGMLGVLLGIGAAAGIGGMFFKRIKAKTKL
ncbi:hypothetical protein TrCOL_g10084 [Triparma columacea]|uniref:DUF2470 domain-containing protein n=1 Tax=Triparma columacea TaxID=722753 RepID=A0A9W7GGD9_9STRA|nr:hypothetical protein TrCOL_g10084 [Triparma columacea]